MELIMLGFLEVIIAILAIAAIVFSIVLTLRAFKAFQATINIEMQLLEIKELLKSKS
jgi:hypothetical protein